MTKRWTACLRLIRLVMSNGWRGSCTAFALVIRSNCAPVITRLPQAWKNPAYRRARRLGQAPVVEVLHPGVLDHVPAEWLPSDGTPSQWS